MNNFGEFSGEPITKWMTEANEPDRKMELLEDFWYRDPDWKEWRVPKGYNKMDGASIPRGLWVLVGSPYTGDYRRASIVHDYACDLAKGDSKKRREADCMFYHACRAGGCSAKEAAILYIGVRIGAFWPILSQLTEENRNLEGKPHVFQTENETKLQQDFQQIAERVLAQEIPNDPAKLENMTEEASNQVLGTEVKDFW
jgi:hypothetical protein